MRLIDRWPGGRAWLYSLLLHGLLWGGLLLLDPDRPPESRDTAGRVASERDVDPLTVFVGDLVRKSDETGPESKAGGGVADGRREVSPMPAASLPSALPEASSSPAPPVAPVAPAVPVADSEDGLPTSAQGAGPEGESFVPFIVGDTVAPLPLFAFPRLPAQVVDAWVLVDLYLTRDGYVRQHEVLAGSGDTTFAFLVERFLQVAPFQPVRREGRPIGVRIRYRFETVSNANGDRDLLIEPVRAVPIVVR